MTIQRMNPSFIVPANIVVSPWDNMQVGESFLTPYSQPRTQDEVDDLIRQGYLLSPTDETNNAFFYKMDEEYIQLEE